MAEKQPPNLKLKPPEVNTLVVSKRVAFKKANLKKIKITIEAQEIEKKESEAISDVVNKAVEYYFLEKVLPSISK